MDELDLNIDINSFVVPIENDIVTFGNYDYMPNSFFRKSTSAYDDERELYGVLQMEGFNVKGTKLQYIVVSYDINYDKIWGEDNNRRYETMYDVIGYFDLPKEDFIVSKFGLEGLDIVNININKMHFNKVTGGSGTYPIVGGYQPKVGDIIRVIYNNYYYEVVNVNHTEEMFLQYKHCWSLIVKPMKIEGIN